MNIAEENINKAEEIYDSLMDLQADLTNARRERQEAIALLKRCRSIMVTCEARREVDEFLEKVK